MKTPRILCLAALAALAACSGNITNPGEDTVEPEPDPEPLCAVQARSYAGFGGALENDRYEAVAGSDRLRAKPFAALADEFRRVLGLEVDTRPYRATFGRPPARWYEEPASSANTLYAAYVLAFEGCLDLTATSSFFETAPTAETAAGMCRGLMRRFWNREPTDDEISSCETLAVSITDPDEGPRRQWAYACAGVLTSADFLAY